MKCNKCGELLDNNLKCPKCDKDDIEIIGFSKPEVKEEPKPLKRKKVKTGLIILISLLFILFITNVILVYNLPNKTAETENNEIGFKKVICDKYVYTVPTAWQYEPNSNNLLLFYNNIKTWGLSVELVSNVNYDNFLQNVESYVNNLKDQGFQYSSTYSKKVNNKRIYLIKGLYEGYAAYIIISEKDEENLVVSKLMFISVVDDSVLDETLNVLTDINEHITFSFDEVSFTFKELKLITEKAAKIE